MVAYKGRIPHTHLESCWKYKSCAILNIACKQIIIIIIIIIGSEHTFRDSSIF